MCVCVRACMRVCVSKEIYSKKLTHMIMETGKSKICSVDWHPGDPGRAGVQHPAEGHRLQNPLLLRGLFSVPFGPATNWMRPTHGMEYGPLYLRSTHLNVNAIQKHSHRNL